MERLEQNYRFQDRHEAGRLLAEKLWMYRDKTEDAVVLALPRGGVPVAYEVASELQLPLDVLTVRKLGVPGHEEYAFGSIASGGIRFVDDAVVRSLHLPQYAVDKVVEREMRELERRERLYRGNRPMPDVHGKTVIIVDDGLATGSTMRAAVRAVRAMTPHDIVVAVPVCAPDTCAELQNNVDTWCVCGQAPEPFYAVGLWYRDFEPTTDAEVQALLAKCGGAAAAPAYSL
jgi:putative phosphoribosyl transferase